LKKAATVALAGALSLGMLSTAMAADVARPAAPLAPVYVAHPYLHPVLWCAGGVVVSVVVHNPIPGVVGCTIGAVELVHHHVGVAR
jgi:hypothetical protein